MLEKEIADLSIRRNTVVADDVIILLSKFNCIMNLEKINQEEMSNSSRLSYHPNTCCLVKEALYKVVRQPRKICYDGNMFTMRSQPMLNHCEFHCCTILKVP